MTNDATKRKGRLSPAKQHKTTHIIKEKKGVMNYDQL